MGLSVMPTRLVQDAGAIATRARQARTIGVPGNQARLRGTRPHTADWWGNQATLRRIQPAGGAAPLGGAQEQDAAPTPASGGGNSRKLTQAERDVAAFIFGAGLNLDPIVLKESAAMTIGGYIRTLPDAMYVPPGRLYTIGMALLMHELTHSFQYQHGVSVAETTANAVKGVYDYGGEAGLRDAIAKKKCFTDFNTEQQGDIVEDYYKRASGKETTYPWNVFIDQVRAGGNCIWPTPGTPAPEPAPRNQGAA